MTNQNHETEIEIVKRWLRQKLLGMVNVQSCLLTRQNSLIIHTWTGVIINVYLIDAPVGTRSIKRILSESSGIGVGSMFIVKDALIPESGTRFEPKEWLMAVHELTRERVYTFRLQNETPIISQVHFEPIGTTGEQIAKYGPNVEFDKLRYYRLSVKPRYIKGDWQVADFGFNGFWHDPYKAHRTQYRKPDTDYSQYKWHSWSQQSWEQDQTTEIPRPPQPRDKLAICYEMLEITREATREEVKAAFRKLALQVHPDTSNLPKDEAERRFRQITEAYEFIKEINKWS